MACGTPPEALLGGRFRGIDTDQPSTAPNRQARTEPRRNCRSRRRHQANDRLPASGTHRGTPPSSVLAVRPYGAICTPLRPAFLTASSATPARRTTSSPASPADAHGDAHGDRAPDTRGRLGRAAPTRCARPPRRAPGRGSGRTRRRRPGRPASPGGISSRRRPAVARRTSSPAAWPRDAVDVAQAVDVEQHDAGLLGQRRQRGVQAGQRVAGDAFAQLGDHRGHAQAAGGLERQQLEQLDVLGDRAAVRAVGDEDQPEPLARRARAAGRSASRRRRGAGPRGRRSRGPRCRRRCSSRCPRRPRRPSTASSSEASWLKATPNEPSARCGYSAPWPSARAITPDS